MAEKYVSEREKERRAAKKAYKEKLRKELKENPDCDRHGKAEGYNLGCRCEKCKEAGREIQALKNKRKRERYRKEKKQRDEERAKKLEAASNGETAYIYGMEGHYYTPYDMADLCEERKGVKYINDLIG